MATVRAWLQRRSEPHPLFYEELLDALARAGLAVVGAHPEVTNVDEFPNVVAICIEGAGFATTTREAAGAMMRVEDWDAASDGWCGN